MRFLGAYVGRLGEGEGVQQQAITLGSCTAKNMNSGLFVSRRDGETGACFIAEEF